MDADLASARGPVTRRSILGATAALGGAGLLGMLLHEPTAPTAPEPKSGTWPLPRYGPRNTARAIDATPPSDPTVETIGTEKYTGSLLIAESGGQHLVLAGTVDGLIAHGPDGAVAWHGWSVPMAVHSGDDICYCTGGKLQALSTVDGTVRWETDSPDAHAIVPTDRGPLVAYNGGISAYDRQGNLRYRISRGNGVGHAGVAVGESVYVTGVHMVERLSPRGLDRELFGGPPTADWRVEQPLRFGHVPSVDDGEVFVTDDSSTSATSRGGVLALSDDGEIRWHRDLGTRPAGMAVGPDRVYVAMETEQSSYLADRFYALHRSDGSTAWSKGDNLDDYFLAPVLAGDVLLLGGGHFSEHGWLRAIDPAGKRRWTVDVDGHVDNVVPAGDRIYVVTDVGHLHVLS